MTKREIMNLFFTEQFNILCGSMKKKQQMFKEIIRLPEFKKELKRLLKKYRTLEDTEGYSREFFLTV